MVSYKWHNINNTLSVTNFKPNITAVLHYYNFTLHYCTEFGTPGGYFGTPHHNCKGTVEGHNRSTLIEEFSFSLHKGAFQDALALRYDWQPSQCPSNCACGSKCHCRSCLGVSQRWFPYYKTRQDRDLHFCNCQPANRDTLYMYVTMYMYASNPINNPSPVKHLTGATSNTQDGARLDITANGFWGGRFERAYFNVRVLNPMCPLQQTNLDACLL